ncbi:MAG: beta-lactamase family protein [Clostridiales Family XIII bacterium]|jgi:CubicO group peptidase (beta-lactamase class C family)|nr:beta-lactamase family protein [Clostridiales Family XIII bacterium]
MNNLKKIDFNTYLNKTVDFHDLASLSVGIYNLKKPESEDFHFCGVQKRLQESHLAVNTYTAYHMASVSKLLTGMSIAQLVSAGKIQYTDQLKSILPALPINGQLLNARIEDMLSHTAGFPDVSGYDWNQPRIADDALWEYVHGDEYKGMKSLEGSDSSFKYSNAAYEILGAIVSEVSGMTYEDYVAKHIFKVARMGESTMLTFRRTEFGKTLRLGDQNAKEIPAFTGMKDTAGATGAAENAEIARAADTAKRNEIENALRALDFEALQDANCALPYAKDEQNQLVLMQNYPYNREHAPSSTLTSNLIDMGRLARAVYEDRIVDICTLDGMTAPRAEVPRSGERVGLSWFIREQNGYELIGHEGSDDGFRSSFYICRELGIATLVTSNTDNARVKTISKKLFELIATADTY